MFTSVWTVKVFLYFCDVIFFDDHLLDLSKSKTNQNFQIIFKIFISICQLLSFYKLLSFILNFFMK